VENLTNDEIIRVGSQADYWLFDKYFFESSLKDPEFHKEIVETVDSDEKYVAIAAPRRHAKTTRISIRHNIWLMLYAKEPYILQISDTYTQAASVIGAIRFQFENNTEIRRVFKPRIIKSTQDEIVIQTAYGRSQIVARGTGQSLRGILDETESRPTLVVCDDLEVDNRVENPELRLADWEWFWKVLLPVLSQHGRIRVIGTILHKYALLKRLIDSSDWKSLIYSVKVSEGVTIWPEIMTWEEMLALMDRYRDAGQIHTFYCEYLNDPVDPENIEFKNDWIQVVSLTQEFLKNMTVTSTVDLAISKKTSACYTSIVTTAWGRDNPPTLYHLDVRRGRWGVYETIEQLFKVKHAFGVAEFGIEKVAYQESLLEVFEMEQQRRQDFCRITPLPPVGAKEERIRAMHALYRRGQVKWANEFPILREEHTSFPHGVTRDCIDAEAYQIKLHTISPDLDKEKPKKDSGAALIDGAIRPRGNPERLGAY